MLYVHESNAVNAKIINRIIINKTTFLSVVYCASGPAINGKMIEPMPPPANKIPLAIPFPLRYLPACIALQGEIIPINNLDSIIKIYNIVIFLAYNKNIIVSNEHVDPIKSSLSADIVFVIKLLISRDSITHIQKIESRFCAAIVFIRLTDVRHGISHEFIIVSNPIYIKYSTRHIIKNLSLNNSGKFNLLYKGVSVILIIVLLSFLLQKK